MAKVLTAAAIKAKLAARNPETRDIPDGGCRGLHLNPKARSWRYRYRRPKGVEKGGISAVLVLGSVDISGKETPGKNLRIGQPLTLAAARALAAEQERIRLDGRDPGAEHSAYRDREEKVAIERAASTFGAAAVQFTNEYISPKKGRKPRGWRDGARILGLAYPDDDGEPSFIEGGLAQRWSRKPVSEVTGHDVYAVIDEARRHAIPGMPPRNKGMSDNRGRKMHAELSRLFGWLVQHRKIVSDPTLGVWHPGAPAARERVLNVKLDVRGADELRWFWTATEKMPEPWGVLLRLLLLTGCRRDEIGDMRWSELNDDMSMLHLPPQRTKNGRPHDVPLPPLARDLLRTVKRIERSPFVFTGSTGTTPVSGWSKMKNLLDELMLTEARKERGDDVAIDEWVVHDLRRTFSSGANSIKIPPHIVEACINHISGAKAGIAGTYNRETYDEERKEALERWADHIQRIVSGESAKIVRLRGRA